jgi:hypothetical protein
MAQQSRNKCVASFRTVRPRAEVSHAWYTECMTKLLEQAVAQLRELPEGFQDKAAQQLIRYVDEVSTDEGPAIEESRQAYQQGEFTSLDQWRHEMGLGGN